MIVDATVVRCLLVPTGDPDGQDQRVRPGLAGPDGPALVQNFSIEGPEFIEARERALEPEPVAVDAAAGEDN